MKKKYIDNGSALVVKIVREFYGLTAAGFKRSMKKYNIAREIAAHLLNTRFKLTPKEIGRLLKRQPGTVDRMLLNFDPKALDEWDTMALEKINVELSMRVPGARLESAKTPQGVWGRVASPKTHLRNTKMDTVYKIYEVVSTSGRIEYWKSPGVRDLRAWLHDVYNNHYMESLMTTINHITEEQAKEIMIEPDWSDKYSDHSLQELFIMADNGVVNLAVLD